MIFVTVGTHEQPFDRLLKKIDGLIESGDITESVFIQTGYSDYVPKFAKSKQFLSNIEMEKNIDEARIVITHGGPASFLSVLSKGKIPIVVPRLLKFNEHVNNHQVVFAEKVVNKGYPIKLVTNIDDILSFIEEYKENDMERQYNSHNEKFVADFSHIIVNMVR
ncbi:glycosyltransferase [Leuconostoc fallax]|uniref:Glycosyl transferase family 28 C-terminal domain-containing protein n=1 Tax=Leuconostoc fallax TaxID=1251 RepID=A0A4R5NBH7_9LACO|nr:glycosyltransferase [Leuconostoc fallax]MBU7454887.1 multidrug MFS transporter [Leuconostoc fallax]TDG69451.1 hypothetical protein C5L23_000913 [Leuconostoc fallax]